MQTKRLQQRLQRQQQQQRWRDPNDWIFNSKQGINFASNDYLGLRQHPLVKNAFKQAVDVYGVGSGASSFVTGYTEAHRALTHYLSELTGRSIVLFPNGYTANVSALTTLCQAQDILVADKYCHASLIDGARYSGARLQRYRHQDIAHADNYLRRLYKTAAWLITESVFSMDGSVTPLTELQKLANANETTFYVDHTHGFGVLNNDMDIFKQANIVMVGLGKAVGCYGAFVVSDPAVIESLIQFARPYMYSTALPPAIAAACLASLRLMQQEPQRRQQLHTIIQYFKRCAEQLALPITASTTPIQTVMRGNSDRALDDSQRLREQGLWVYPMRPPSVPANRACLRIILNITHQKTEIEQLCEALWQCHRQDKMSCIPPYKAAARI